MTFGQTGPCPNCRYVTVFDRCQNCEYLAAHPWLKSAEGRRRPELIIIDDPVPAVPLTSAQRDAAYDSFVRHGGFRGRA